MKLKSCLALLPVAVFFMLVQGIAVVHPFARPYQRQGLSCGPEGIRRSEKSTEQHADSDSKQP